MKATRFATLVALAGVALGQEAPSQSKFANVAELVTAIEQREAVEAQTGRTLKEVTLRGVTIVSPPQESADGSELSFYVADERAASDRVLVAIPLRQPAPLVAQDLLEWIDDLMDDYTYASFPEQGPLLEEIAVLHEKRLQALLGKAYPVQLPAVREGDRISLKALFTSTGEGHRLTVRVLLFRRSRGRFILGPWIKRTKQQKRAGLTQTLPQ